MNKVVAMKIAVVGAYGVGKTMRIPQFPAAGETVSGGRYSAGPGGKGSNQAIALARLGADVELVTAIGMDDAGREARALWETEGVGTTHVAAKDAATMVGFILVDNSGENEIAIAPGALDHFGVADVEAFRATIQEADMLLVSLEIPVETACAALRIAHEEGTIALLNPAPAIDLPAEVLEWVDIFTPNQSEAARILGLDDSHGLTPEELLTRLRAKMAGTIVLTLGSDGCAVLGTDGPVLVPPFAPPAVVDTTGAGDTFTAALAIALSEGQGLTDAVRFASAAGAHAVTVAGVIDALPTRDDIERILAAPASDHTTDR